jgi:hypothetical protein
LFLFLDLVSYSQKYALIDRDFKKPILFTDSVTISQVNSNYYPIRTIDIDSVLANCNFLISELKNLQRAKFKSYKIHSGNTIVQVETVSKAYGDSYNIILQTKADIVIAEYLIASNRELNKRAIKNLLAFTNYIKSDKELVVHEFINYNPVIFDATVFINSR